MERTTRKIGDVDSSDLVWIWQCLVCKGRFPDADPYEWEFVNFNGECPRCQAREMAKEEK